MAASSNQSPLVLHGLSASSVVVLFVGFMLPLGLILALLLCVFGVVIVGRTHPELSTVPVPDPAAVLAYVAAVVGAFTALVVVAIALRVVVNLLGSRSVSPALWGGICWVVSAPIVMLLMGISGGVPVAEVALVLWVAVGVGGGSVLASFVVGRVLWAWGRRSALGAATNILAALVLVVVPDLALGFAPVVYDSLRNLEATSGFRRALGGMPPPALPVMAVPSVAPWRALAAAGSSGRLPGVPGSDDGAGEPGGPSGEDCYRQLTGDGCGDVWTRTHRGLGLSDPGSEDALQGAFLYVCLLRRYAPPRLCGAFALKAQGLKRDLYRYDRRRCDLDPPCPMPTPEDQTMSAEEQALLLRAECELGDRERQILELKYKRGKTDAEIAAEVGISEVHARRLRHAAEAALAEKLQRCR